MRLLSIILGNKSTGKKRIAKKEKIQSKWYPKLIYANQQVFSQDDSFPFWKKRYLYFATLRF